MNPRSGWLEEFWRLVLLLLGALAAGWYFGHVQVWLLLVLLAYTLRSIYNLQRLANWLGNPRIEEVPIHFGIWGDIYSRISRVNARHDERERRLNRLVEEYVASTSALPDATVTIDSGGRIRWFNEAASRLLGLVAAKDVGQPLKNLFRNPEFSEFMRRRDFSQGLRLNAPGNPQRRLEVRLAPYGDDQTLLLAQDITERDQQERVRSDFVANVSHELRTPLTVISGFVENLQADAYCQNERLTRPLQLMSQQTSRMRQIVEDLLLLARLEGGTGEENRQTVDVAQLLETIADECRALRADPPGIVVEVESDRRVKGDPKQLHSAISNLVTNAVHHTPAGGRITLGWRDEGSQSLLTVQDTGEGIAAEHLARITERFYRVDSGRSRERGGTGLGLAIVKHVLRHHDATLEISSQPGFGSRFACRFAASRLLG